MILCGTVWYGETHWDTMMYDDVLFCTMMYYFVRHILITCRTNYVIISEIGQNGMLRMSVERNSPEGTYCLSLK